MSGSHRDDRPALVALALILAALVFVAVFESGARRFDDQSVHNLSGYGGAAQIPEHAKGDIANTDTGVDGFDFWRDPFPQYAMAFSALIAAGTGVLGVFWLKQTLDATRDTADAAKGANDLARQQFMTSFKPWLEITAIGPFLFDPEMIKDFREDEVIRVVMGCCGIKVRNIGEMPATIEEFQIWLLPGEKWPYVPELHPRHRHSLDPVFHVLNRGDAVSLA